MTRGRLVVHAHFYQPFRVDPFTGHIPDDRSAVRSGAIAFDELGCRPLIYKPASRDNREKPARRGEHGLPGVRKARKITS